MTGLAYGLGAVLSLVAAGAGLQGLLGEGWALRVDWLVPLGGLELRMEPLGAFFLLVVGCLGLPASVYALEYARGEGRGLIAYNVFLVSMGVVPLAANLLTFLLAWEMMSLASYALVLTDRERREAVRAAWTYAVMTHGGLACLLGGMLLLTAWTGSVRFADWEAAAPGLPPGGRNAVFVLLAVGFATKAGVIPLHVWLPAAHPAAPSHVSALMSGAMIKLGVYGLLRAALGWLGEGPPWWGVVILLAGAASAVIGVLYALVEHDLKRLLAFHSIENIGIILIGLGAGMLFSSARLPGLAVLAVAAALYHTLNHALFKALLFLGAGAVVHATGTRDMERMGGLIHRLPLTAVWFLVGSAAISALPPLNGFVSEWLTFQALLQTTAIPRAEVNLVFALGLAALALTGGLAMACFVKAFGITFLALPRSGAAEGAREVGPAMHMGMAPLAGACLALGLGVTAALPLLTGTARSLLGAGTAAAAGDWLTVHVSGDFAGLSTLTVGAALAAGLLLPLGALLLVGAARRGRRYETWGCGRVLQTARMEYTATAFASPFKRVFDFFYRPRLEIAVRAHPGSRLFVERIEYRSETRSLFDEWLYRPLLVWLRRGARPLRALQSGNPNLYLIYVLAALLAMLVLA
jgi:hydrogenase-4 component B